MDLTSSPREPRCSFPYADYTPYARSVRTFDELVPLSTSEHSSSLDQFSRYEDVSSSKDGVCMVTCCTLCLSNSHAGTHADTPAHFIAGPCRCGDELGDGEASAFEDAQYEGPCLVLDISDLLPSSSPVLESIDNDGLVSRRTITRTILESAAARAGIDFSKEVSSPLTFSSSLSFLSSANSVFLYVRRRNECFDLFFQQQQQKKRDKNLRNTFSFPLVFSLLCPGDYTTSPSNVFTALPSPRPLGS